MHGTIQQLTENNESEYVVLSWKISWTSNSNHGFACAKMSISNWLMLHCLTTTFLAANSGMLLMNLAILKLFVDGRNSFTIEDKLIFKFKKMRNDAMSTRIIDETMLRIWQF